MGFKQNSEHQHLEMASRIRQNFKEESEALINKQINMEFYASYVYMSMYTYFDRDDTAYPGFAAFFKKSSDGDAHLCDYIESEFLDEQVEGIKEISTWITKMKRAGPGLGYHMIDKEIGS